MGKTTTWYWFSCPECAHTWGSENRVANREWCVCCSAEEPEFLYEEMVSL